ncbi:hypothetical protein D3C81_1694250 [compost metagenome]
MSYSSLEKDVLDISDCEVLLSAAVVASVIVTPTVNTTATNTAVIEIFPVFIIAVILSSIAFLLKLLHNGMKLLFFSSILMSV